MSEETVEKPEPIRFTFDHHGKNFAFPVPLFDAITVGFIRLHRNLPQTDWAFSALEALAGETVEGQQILGVIDNMTRDEFRAVADQLDKQLGALSGE